MATDELANVTSTASSTPSMMAMLISTSSGNAFFCSPAAKSSRTWARTADLRLPIQFAPAHSADTMPMMPTVCHEFAA